MKIRILLINITILFTSIISAQITDIKTAKDTTIGQENIPTDPDVKIGKLSNGLTYYIKNNSKPADKVELRLVVNAGSILEDEDQLGLAHFLEHMNFNGTKNFKKNDLVDYLQSIGVKFGAHLNAYTSFDETVYILPIPSDDPEKLEKGFQILEDWAHNALLLDKDIDEERGVVLEEYRLSRGAGERMLQKYLPKVLHGSKYAKRLPIGTKENLETFKHESLRRFYKDWYRPDLMAVIAVGDVDVTTLEQKIKAHFGQIPIPENPKKRPVFEVPNHEETLIAIESDKESPFTRVQIMYKDHNRYKNDETIEDYRRSMVKSLFTTMINNRLDELRNSEDPPFVFGYSYHGSTWARNKRAYQSIANSSETGQLKALEALLTENERVKRHGFTKGEFDRAKKSILAGYEKSFKDKDKTESRRIIGQYVNNYLENEPIPSITWEYNFYENNLDNVKLSEVNGLIKNYLHDDNRVIVLTNLEKEGLKKVTETDIRNLLEEVKTKDVGPYKEDALATSLISKLPKKGSITNTTANDDLGIGTITLKLSNGAKIVYKKTDFKNDEILFEAFSYGGSSLYSNEEYLATVFANSGLTEAGINSFSKTDLSKMMSGKIASVRPFISGYSEGMSGSSTPKNFEELFQLIHLYFTSLNKDEKAFNSFVSKQKSFLGNLLASPQFYFQNELSKFIYGKNPRYSGFPTPEKYDSSDYNLAYNKYRERFSDAGDFNFYFVGNIDDALLKDYAEKYIASLPGKNSNENYVVRDFRPLTGNHTKVVEKGSDPKSQVRITFHGPTDYDQKEAFALKSLGEILTIKLIEKLREEEGGVYGVGASGNISKVPYGWYNLRISFPCGPENVEKLKNAALAELKKILDEGPTGEDVAKVKEAQLLQHKEDLKKNKFWIKMLKTADYEKKEIISGLSFEDHVKSITAKDIQNVGKKYLSKDYILAIHNPEK
ncbi:pitrilysin family protein [Seonamhaeicola sp.]|uniref:M16 family metallopeptidase n=1 Tax=Seonamhaeicola sp. TaxID=1912245 RepID=UPI00261E2174|nr:insulinase family protein [Seonamhaeicola sp.]